MVRPLLRYVVAVAALVLLVGAGFTLYPQIWPPDPDNSVTLKDGQFIGEAVGFVWATDPSTATIQVSASLVGFRAIPMTVSTQTRITDGAKEGAFGDLGKYTRVRVVYEAREDGRLAKSIELLRNGAPGGPAAAEVAARRAPAPGYWVEVGVFTDPEAAGALVARLLEHNLTVSLESVTLRGQQRPVLRVQVGPFADEAAATAAQQNLRAIGYQAHAISMLSFHVSRTIPGGVRSPADATSTARASWPMSGRARFCQSCSKILAKYVATSSSSNNRLASRLTDTPSFERFWLPSITRRRSTTIPLVWQFFWTRMLSASKPKS
jgi:hypothetical protein